MNQLCGVFVKFSNFFLEPTLSCWLRRPKPRFGMPAALAVRGSVCLDAVLPNWAVPTRCARSVTVF